MKRLPAQTRALVFFLALVFVATFTVSAQPAGTPVLWGSMADPVPAALTNNVTAIAAGSDYTLAVQADGTVVSWGPGSFPVPSGLSRVRSVAAGAYHGLALRSNSTVVAWGQNDAGQTNVPPGLTNVVAVAAGDFYSLALLGNGVLRGWGGNVGTVNLSGVTMIAAGPSHALALQDGWVIAWGNNAYGQIEVPALQRNSVIGLAAGATFSMALRTDGSVVVWGAKNQTPPIPPFTSGATAIAAGSAHALAIRNGRVVAWGQNASGQTTVPPGVSNVVAISGGYSHSVALSLSAPTIITQPQNQNVQEGSPASFSVLAVGSLPLRYQWRKDGVNITGATNASYAIASVRTNHVANYRVVVRNDAGAVTSAVARLSVNVPPFITREPQNTDVGAGTSVELEVQAGGSPVLAFQWTKSGQAVTPWGLSGVYRITQAKVEDSGQYRAWVSNSFGVAASQTAVLTVHPLPAFTVHPESRTVLAGSAASFAVIASNATGLQWLKNGAVIPGATEAALHFNSVQSGDAGTYSVMATNAYGSKLSSNATLTVTVPGAPTTNIVLWGQGVVLVGSEYVNLTPPGGLDDVIAISAGRFHHLALRRDGRVEAWGANNYSQATPPVGLLARTVAAGGHHSLALRPDGTVTAWGRPDDGRTSVPANLTNVVRIAAGEAHSLALKADGTIVAWGLSAHGQTNVPASVSNIVDVAAGLSHSLALRSGGTVMHWGDNDFYQGRIPLGLSNAVAIAAGDYHSLALLQDGRVVAWGWNDHGQTNVPAGLSQVIAIAAGARHCMALRRDGTVVCWGSDSDYQSTPPNQLDGVFAITAGGARSLALRRPVIRLSPLTHQGQVFTLRATTREGGIIDPGQAARCEVFASPNPALPYSAWTRLGVLNPSSVPPWTFTDATTATVGRFYMLRETP